MKNISYAFAHSCTMNESFVDYLFVIILVNFTFPGVDYLLSAGCGGGGGGGGGRGGGGGSGLQHCPRA